MATPIDFRPAAVDSGEGAALVQAMREEMAAVYDGLALDGAQMPSDGRRGHSLSRCLAGKAGPAELGPPEGAFLVGWRDGEAVCCGGIKRLPDEEGAGPACEVKRMFVAPAARGQGVAQALLRALEDLARAMGYAVARLDTGPRQPHAQRLYASEGYREIANFDANPVATFFGEKAL